MIYSVQEEEYEFLIFPKGKYYDQLYFANYGSEQGIAIFTFSQQTGRWWEERKYKVVDINYLTEKKCHIIKKIFETNASVLIEIE